MASDAASPSSPGEEAKKPSKFNLLRRLYNWVLSWADSRYGTLALFILAFAEASFFPIPPDVLLIALALGSVKRSFRFAAVCTIGSVLGGWQRRHPGG